MRCPHCRSLAVLACGEVGQPIEDFLCLSCERDFVVVDGEPRAVARVCGDPEDDARGGG